MGIFSSKKKQPKAPDPEKTAAAQYKYNKLAGEDTLKLNAINQYGPLGSTTYQKDANGLPVSQTVNLSPEMQAYLNSQFAASTGLGNAAAAQIANIPTDRFELPDSPNAHDNAIEAFGANAVDPSKLQDLSSLSRYDPTQVNLAAGTPTDEIARTSYEQAKSLVQPDIDAARKQLEVQLAQRGIHPGDEIWHDEMDRLDRNTNNTYSSLSRQAMLDAGQEASRQFQENLGRSQFAQGEDQRLASDNIANNQFAQNLQGQQFNQISAANTYGTNKYQTDLSNLLLERNQPYSEAAALLGSSPNFQSPSFMNTPQAPVGSPDYTGVVNNNYAQQMANYRANPGSSGLSSLASLGTAAISAFSSEDLKKNRTPADGNNILVAFRDMPVDDYQYRKGAREALDLPEHRTGTMAQDYAEHFGGDGVTIDMADAVGKLMAAVKALDARTRGKDKGTRKA